MKARFLLIPTAALAAASTFIHPLSSRTPTVVRPMFSGAQIDAETLAIFQRSCADCHSDGTAWPWYSKVPPMSWMIENDVGTARARMNLSHWADYSAVERQAYLSFISAVVQTKRMPLPRYTRLHPEARLSATEIQTIRLWTSAQRKLLKEQEDK